MNKTQIIILAAGKGSRMGGDIPKALTPLGDQSMLEHVLDTVESLEMPHKPIVVVGYKADMIKDTVGDRAVYAMQEKQQGTGHAVMCAQDLINHDTERIVILYADQPFISRETLVDIITQHELSPNPLTIATAHIDDTDLFEKQFYNFGRIIRGDDNQIIAIVESKDANESQKAIREVNPAYFCCDADWAFTCLSKLKNDNAQGEYYLTDLVTIAFESQYPIESISINEKEALGANTPEQLQVLISHM